MELNFSQTVKALRKERGITQEELANHLGISVQSVSRTGIEPNCPTTMHFRIFRRAFACKICILLRKITPKSIKNAFAGGCEQF